MLPRCYRTQPKPAETAQTEPDRAGRQERTTTGKSPKSVNDAGVEQWKLAWLITRRSCGVARPAPTATGWRTDEQWASKTATSGLRFVVGLAPMEAEQTERANLDKVEHIVILMMENRSFDHMLGYLSLGADNGQPLDVDGLTPEMGNEDRDGTFQRVEPLGARLIHEKVLDPGHGKADVEAQLRDGNAGFLKNYEEAFKRNRERRTPPDGFVFDPTLVLGYQEAKDVPVYDYLARNYRVCDRWFSSVPGPTWPNRLYAVTGGEGPRDELPLPKKAAELLKHAPIYDRPAFVRWLDEEAWRWYSHDPATLRMIDSRYRPGGEEGAGSDENFAYFNRKSLFERRTFLDDASRGELPAVSWIDPNFVDFRLYGPPGSNDDHPPSRVMLGQELVLTVLTALTSSVKWERTMLVITYDEHGGFYDHVPPGDFEVPGEPGASYGVRVPALVVSPLCEAAPCHTVFDHTSIIKTILLRFANDPDEAITALGPRTAAANHLGELLTRDEPREPSPREELEQLIDKVRDAKLRAYAERLLEEPQPGESLFEAVTDLQGEIVGAGLQLRGDGLPPGKP